MAAYSLPDYHERSKHRLDRYAPGPGRLDWANQPNPFRHYDGARRIALPLRADHLDVAYDAVRRGLLPAPHAFDLDSIATLLELSLGLSAWKAYGETTWALRCNPSSGNLHPTEGYLVTGGMPGVAAGVHHYVSCDHVLEQRGPWDGEIGLPGVLVGLAGIHWREAWKYGMRAFRYCQHDCGHAIAAVSYAASALGWRARVLAAPGDERVSALLGLGTDPEPLEAEAPDCLVWVSAGDAVLGSMPPAPSHWHGKANRLSSAHLEWADIGKVHELTLKPELDSEPQSAPETLDEIAPQANCGLPAAQIIRQRRSAVSFDGTTRIAADAFFAMLDATLPRESAAPWAAWPWPPAVHLTIMVHRVDGLDPGLYVLVRAPEALATLEAALRPEWLWRKVGPPGLPLYLLLAHDLRAVAQQICCHQEIAADSCFALGRLARYELALAEPWRYRTLHWECGMVGQVLYLEAEAAGIRATGIGCYFDDEMHSLLGLQGRSWQSLYHFTAGGAVDDARLTTRPPYDQARIRR